CSSRCNHSYSDPVSVSADDLIDSSTTNGHFNDYDMVIWDCRGNANDNPSAAEQTRMRNYLDAGGRFFASDFAISWIVGNGDMDDSATWRSSRGTGDDETGYVSLGRAGANDARIEPFARWLDNEDAANVTYAAGVPTSATFTIAEPRDWITSVGADAEEWVYRSPGGTSRPQQYSFNTPYGADADN